MDQRACVWPVEEGGGSSSSGPAVPEDVEESEPVKKARGADSTNSNKPRRAHGQWACSVQNLVSRVLVASDVADCISIVPVEEKPRPQ